MAPATMRTVVVVGELDPGDHTVMRWRTVLPPGYPLYPPTVVLRDCWGTWAVLGGYATVNLVNGEVCWEVIASPFDDGSAPDRQRSGCEQYSPVIYLMAELARRAAGYVRHSDGSTAVVEPATAAKEVPHE